jgi:hypothetical protein
MRQGGNIVQAAQKSLTKHLPEYPSTFRNNSKLNQDGIQAHQPLFIKIGNFCPDL